MPLTDVEKEWIKGISVPFWRTAPWVAQGKCEQDGVRLPSSFARNIELFSDLWQEDREAGILHSGTALLPIYFYTKATRSLRHLSSKPPYSFTIYYKSKLQNNPLTPVYHDVNNLCFFHIAQKQYKYLRIDYSILG